jgi:hypothetical protein
MQLAPPTEDTGGTKIVKPTRRGHNFTANRHRGRHRVAPLATVDRLDSTAPPTTERVWCPKCDKCHAVSVDYDYVFYAGGTRKHVKRVGYCDGCEMVYWWDQHCGAGGQPFGRPIDGSLVTNDRASTVESVLKIYPQLRGVQQV